MKIGFYCLLFLSSTSWAGSAWHCSRNSENSASNYHAPAPEDQFSIASVSSSVDVINVSVRDLIDLYSGSSVHISGRSLSACFMPSNEALTSNALKELGLRATTIQALSRKNSIVQTNLYLVTDEKQMLQCISKHFPAVGYVSEMTETDLLAPCF
jgi:hypothetical protein